MPNVHRAIRHLFTSVAFGPVSHLTLVVHCPISSPSYWITPSTKLIALPTTSEHLTFAYNTSLLRTFNGPLKELASNMSDVSHFSITHYVYYWPDKRGCNHYQVVDSQTYEPCALDILERRGNRAVHTDTPPYSVSCLPPGSWALC